MPYKFNEYVSTYIDPQSIKISEALQQRYKENLAASDQLYMALDQMKAALPFEKDLQRKKELQAEIDKNLNMLSDRGDYENLGFAVHKTAKDFSKKYAPMKENYERYSQYINDFNEALKKGDYNAEQQRYLSQYMLKTANGPYKGFEIDPETGRVKEGSLFSGPTIYKDPKIMDRVTERLKMLHEQKTGKTVQRVGQGADGSLVIESGSSTSVIPQPEVDKVIQAVMAESDVKAYVDQLSDMKTYSFQANGQLPQVFEAQVKGYTEMLTDLNNTLNSKGLSSSQRAQVKAQLATVNQEINKLKEASQDENLMYAHIQGKIKDEIWKPIKDFASLKGGVYEQTSTYKESYDALWLDDYKRQKDFEEKYGTPFEEISSIDATMYGETIEEQMKVAGDKDRLAQELEQKAGDKNNGLAQSVRQDMLRQAANLRTEAGLINQNIKQAGDLAFNVNDLQKTDSMIMDVIKDLYPGKSAGEYGLILKRVFDSPNDQDFKDFQRKFDSWHGRGAFDAYSIQNFNGMVQPNSRQEDLRVYSSSDIGAKQVFEKYGLGNLFSGANGAVVDYRSVFNTINSKFSNVNEGINSKLKEVKMAVPLLSGVLPGVNNEESRMITTAADKYFKDRGLSTNLTVTDIESGEQLTGSELAQFTTKNYQYNPNTGNWHLTMEGEVAGVKNRKSVILDGNQVGNDLLRKWQNSPTTKFAGSITRHDTGVKGDVREFGVNEIGDDGNRTGKQLIVKVESQGAGNQPLVQFYDPTTGSTSNKMYMTDPQVREVTGINAKTGNYLFEW